MTCFDAWDTVALQIMLLLGFAAIIGWAFTLRRRGCATRNTVERQIEKLSIEIVECCERAVIANPGDEEDSAELMDRAMIFARKRHELLGRHH